MSSTLTKFALLALSTGALVEGQFSGWIKDQRNTTLCRWPSLRASAIQDAVYLDGGRIFWVPGMSDGHYELPQSDNNPLALAYKLNFSRPFDTSTGFNYTNLLEPMPKVGSGNAGTNVAPNYADGAMLANDHEFFLYGGTSQNIPIYRPQAGNEIVGYRLSQYTTAAVPGQFFPGGFFGLLPDTVTRYITFGGGASAPSENKAWYFSGMRSASGGPIFSSFSNKTIAPTNTSQTLITLDMGQQNFETWSNTTVPNKITARANPEVVWVPVGPQGILAVLGGVTFPDYATAAGVSEDAGQSMLDSPKFMEEISIYDVASGSWYKQTTTGDIPGQLAQGCTVVATAQDASSFNIYWYGGYPALKSNQGFEDGVWVLSLPSFIWTKVNNGTIPHARIGHKCVRPYPDQMMSIGGIAQSSGSVVGCLEGVVQVFNLTSAEWLSSYNPSVYMSNYSIPDKVVQAIGGTPAGGATQKTPRGGWDEEDLGGIFAKAYDRNKITTYFPYASDTSEPPPRTDLDVGSGGLPSWVAPVLGVVLGLVFLSALVVAILLYRRRKLLKRNGGTTTVSTADENGGRILSWIRGQHSEKAPTVMTEDTTLHLNDLDSKIAPMVGSHATGPSTVATYEAPNNILYEMDDTSRPPELSDTGLTPVDIINKHTHFAKRPEHRRHQSGSWQSGTVSQEHARSVSPNYASGSERPDSPSIGNPISSPSSGSLAVAGPGASASGVHSSAASMTAPAAAGLPPLMDNHHQQASSTAPPPPRNAVISGISLLSEQDRTHLRHLSASSVSSATATLPNSAGLVNGFQQHQDHDEQYQQVGPAEVAGDYPPPVSPSAMGTLDLRGAGMGTLLSPTPPISPPTAEEREGMDYLTSQPVRSAAGGDQRRSVFHEDTDEFGQQQQQQQHQPRQP
ncbi:uncharacterized protein B0I36DRAFT_349202 [Microdochium trichocladiopsis]|uniref:Kelch repeat protein n=1 Tax=Microdochium trichocladiopsis TaxID=1682393 RepID=A0A9P9BQP3_9PEZI|nr:uncharacterized protein B0I36DRAFT_349202 [Microdochium trichocladiopsis]KAH7031070.1 hypothetical protein B0I36DRAFT_349202 [Microdochium trichocladiopsis]